MNDSLDSLDGHTQTLMMFRQAIGLPIKKEIVPAWKTMRYEQQAQKEYETRQKLVSVVLEEMDNLYDLLTDGNQKIKKLHSVQGLLVIEYEQE